MCRWGERARAARAARRGAATGPGGRDGGFTLVEVVVALGVLMVVVTALLPQLVVAIKSTGTSRQTTQAKGVVQAELERMRNLPYHISRDAGEFVDVLDYYYTKVGTTAANGAAAAPTCTTAGGRLAPPQAGWQGYVAAGAPRCAYEPATGPFYRVVRQVPAADGIGAFTIVVSTQFLSADTPPQPVTPVAGYDTFSTDPRLSQPPASQIGVTATVLYTDRATLRPTTTYTQIVDQPPVTTRVRAEATATAVEAGSVTSAGVPVTLTAGLVNLTGSLTHASTVGANLSGTAAGLATGQTAGGSSAAATAPPARAAVVGTGAPGSLTATGCAEACWGATRSETPALTTASGLPSAGSPTDPAQALVTSLVNGGISFGGAPAGDYRPELLLAPPLVQLDPSALLAPSGVTAGCAPGSTGASSYVAGGGYVRTTATDASVDPSTVEACAVARSARVALFRTGFAPRGVVHLELVRASARCRVTGTGHTPSAALDYEAVVRYWDGTDYQVAATITPSTTTDPLAALDLRSISVGGGRVLGDYVDSWRGLTSAGVTRTATGGTATAKLPGVLTLVTQPVRPDASAPAGDPTSVVSLTLGALGCTAEDAR